MQIIQIILLLKKFVVSLRQILNFSIVRRFFLVVVCFISFLIVVLFAGYWYLTVYSACTCQNPKTIDFLRGLIQPDYNQPALTVDVECNRMHCGIEYRKYLKFEKEVEKLEKRGEIPILTHEGTEFEQDSVWQLRNRILREKGLIR